LPILEGATKRTKPRKTSFYDVFCGILYLLKSGNSLMLWKKTGIFKKVLQKLIEERRKKSG